LSISGSCSTGKITITESTGTAASANDGSLVIKHDNNYGSSSITFPSKINNGSDYGFIQYQDNYNGNNEAAKLILGTQNDTGEDFVILHPCGGSGRVGVNTYTPSYSLHVNGTFYVSSNANFNDAISMNDKAIYLRGTSSSDTNHYVRYDSGRDGVKIGSYAGTSFHIGGSEKCYITSNEFYIYPKLNLYNNDNHNVRVSSYVNLTADTQIPASGSSIGYHQQIYNITMGTNNLLITFKADAILDGTMFNIANVAGSSMRFKVATGISYSIFNRDNTTYTGSQIMSFTNTRRVSFVKMGSGIFEMFRYP
jgi:hypothetical protein